MTNPQNNHDENDNQPDNEQNQNQHENMMDDAPEEIYEENGAEGPDINVEEFTPESRIAALEEALAVAKDKMIRAVSEAENVRRRSLREREDVRKYAVAEFARDLLGFSDNFSRAMESIPEDLLEADERVAGVINGIDAMEKELQRCFEKHGIQKIEPEGETFNPNFHEVMFEAPGTGQPAGTIIQIIEPGYVIKDRLLRPARVGVAKDEGQGQAPSQEPGSNIDQEA